MPTHDTQVIVVGSGPTGLAAALLLARCGIKVRVLDKSPSQAHESRAFGVHAKTMELFQSLGLADEFLERGLITTGLQIFVDGKQAAELNFDDIGRSDTPFAYVLMVPQFDIEDILAKALSAAGVEVEHSQEVIGLEQDEEGVSVEVRDAGGKTRKLSADYLVGADGAHSLVRKKLGLAFDGAAYAQSAMLADCKVEWPHSYDHLTLFLRGSSLGAYLPLRGKDFCRIMVLSQAQGETDESIEAQGSHPIELAKIESAFREVTGLKVSLLEPRWTSDYRVHHRGVNQYRASRAFVAGDAAHIHSPAGGQGMNTGVQDAANLAWKLALVLKGGEPQGLLDSYHSERWPIGQNVLRYTDRVFSGMTGQRGWAASLRNKLLPVVAGGLSKSGMARARAFNFVSQLGIHYPPSDFIYGSLSPKAPRAGYRAPNAAVGPNRNLFGLLQGYKFHVLALSRKALDSSEIAYLAGGLAQLPKPKGMELETHLVAHSLMGRDPRLVRAESSQIFQAYSIGEGTLQALLLIRPDGYIAYRADSLNLEGLGGFIRNRLSG